MVGWLRVVFLATIYNLLFEYSFRSVYDLSVRPTLPFLLFVTYFSFFMVVDDFKRRFKLMDHQLCLFVMALTTLYSVFFLPGTYFFIEPRFLGINWTLFFWIHVLWWAIFQTIIPFYIAKRLSFTSPEQPASKVRLVVGLALYIFTGMLFKIGIKHPALSTIGVSLALVLAIIFLLILWRSVRYTRLTTMSTPSRFIDLLAVSAIFVMVICAFFLPYSPSKILYHPVNRVGVNVMEIWSTATAILLIIYRLGTRRAIPI